MRRIDVKSMISVFSVRDMERALSWYRKWLGEPDVFPMEETAEYRICENAWLQLSCEGQGETGKGAVIIGVEDAPECRKNLEALGIEAGEIVDYEAVLVFDVFDPDGNKISFVQELGEDQD